MASIYTQQIHQTSTHLTIMCGVQCFRHLRNFTKRPRPSRSQKCVLQQIWNDLLQTTINKVIITIFANVWTHAPQPVVDINIGLRYELELCTGRAGRVQWSEPSLHWRLASSRLWNLIHLRRWSYVSCKGNWIIRACRIVSVFQCLNWGQNVIRPNHTVHISSSLYISFIKNRQNAVENNASNDK